MSLPTINTQPATPAALPNNRIGSDWRAVIKLKDNGVAVDWTTAEIEQIFMISESQAYAFAGLCEYTIDADVPTKMHIVWRAGKQLYQGIHRVVAQVSLSNSEKTFDKRAVNIVPLSDSESVAYPEDDTTIELEVSDVDTSIMASILSACQEATKNVNELIAYCDAEEDERQDAETARAAAETARVTAENTRKSNENTRKSQETTRKNQETARVSAEQSRVLAEDLRVEAEEHRNADEALRVSAETSRSQAETARVRAESTRVSQENTRKSNELTRQNNESTRQNNENERLGHETLRMSAESSRVSAEQSRVSAETARVSAENARVAAESSRQATIDAKANNNAVVHLTGDETIQGKKVFTNLNTKPFRVVGTDGEIVISEADPFEDRAAQLKIQGTEGDASILVERDPLADLEVATKQYVDNIASKVGDLSSLATTDKTSIVNAVNELRNNIISTLNTAV